MRDAGGLTPNEACATRVHPSRRGGAAEAAARLSVRAAALEAGMSRTRSPVRRW